MSQEHDDRLQVEAAQRDPSRFADLYERNFTRVYAYIIRRVGDRHQPASGGLSGGARPSSRGCWG